MALRSLSRDGVALPPHAFDVRGWETRTEPDDARVGEVHDLLLDGDGTPRHLVVSLRRGDGGEVLVPLSRAWADASRRTVWISGMRSERLLEMPRYVGDPAAVSPALEARVLEEYRRGAPAAASGEASGSGADLARLDDLEGLRVAKGSTDPRGWTVVGGDGQKVGVVAELLVDRGSMRARYIDCDVDEERLELEHLDRHVLFPVDRIRLDHGEHRVVVEGLFGRDLARYPIYTGLPLTAEAEAEIAARFEAGEGEPEAVAAWAEPAARRFFAARRRSARSEGAESSPAPAAADPTAEVAPQGAEGGAVRVRLPEEGDVRIRVKGDEIVVERSREPGGRRG